jgi:hypothetical protein
VAGVCEKQDWFRNLATSASKVERSDMRVISVADLQRKLTTTSDLTPGRTLTMARGGQVITAVVGIYRSTIG